MSTASDFIGAAAVRAEPAGGVRRERWQARISRTAGFLNVLGLGWIAPLLRIAIGEPIKPELTELWRSFGIPVARHLDLSRRLGIHSAKSQDKSRDASRSGAGLAAGREFVG